MFIQTESTPNPATLKFLPGVPVLTGGTAFYTNAQVAKESPLAAALFTVEGVSAIFLGADFITVTKTENASWDVLKPILLNALLDYWVTHKAEAAKSSATQAGENTASAEDSELVAQIKELIDTRVRPAVAMDGGDIVFHSFEEGVVKLELRGACSGCPSSTATLRQGVENMLKHYVPEVVAVEAVM